MIELGGVLAGKRVLVTGGSGLIGQHLSQCLVELQAEVTILDLQEPPSSLKGRVRYITCDIRDREGIGRAVQGQQILFHLAALLGVEKIINQPLEVLDVNLQGTLRLLEAACRSRVERFVFSSSSEVYGEPWRVPVREEDPKAPLSIYGVAKLAAEAYCRAFWSKYSLPIVCLRFFNVYGPGQVEHFVIPIFITRVSSNQPPIIYGSGDQIRCYTYVDDAVQGLLLAALHPKAVGETFNIANPRPVIIKDLAKFIIQCYQADLEPEFRFFGDGIRHEEREVKVRIPDIGKARNLLGFQPQISFEEGIRHFIAWWSSQHHVVSHKAKLV